MFADAGVKRLNPNLKGQSPPSGAQGWRSSREMRVAFLQPHSCAGKAGGRRLRVVKLGATADGWPPAFPGCHRRGHPSPKDTALLGNTVANTRAAWARQPPATGSSLAWPPNLRTS